MQLRVRHAAYPACWIWPRSQLALRRGFLFTGPFYEIQRSYVKIKMIRKRLAYLLLF
jgi:hypothetical protein